jgi:hypothetical protein
VSEPKNVGGFLVRRMQAWERDYTTIPNAYVRDGRLSYKARGILAVLMSHQDGYQLSLKALAESSREDGIAAVRTAVNELETFGYLVRVDKRLHGGNNGTRWELTDPTVPLFDPVDNTPSTPFENRTSENRTSENRMQTPFENRTQEEDQVKKTRASQGDPTSGAARPGDNSDAFGAPSDPLTRWLSERCPADWHEPPAPHDLGTNGKCRGCYEPAPREEAHA